MVLNSTQRPASIPIPAAERTVETVDEFTPRERQIALLTGMPVSYSLGVVREPDAALVDGDDSETPRGRPASWPTAEAG